MRGKGAFFARVHCPDGITPAYAGKRNEFVFAFALT